MGEHGGVSDCDIWCATGAGSMGPPDQKTAKRGLIFTPTGGTTEHPQGVSSRRQRRTPPSWGFPTPGEYMQDSVVPAFQLLLLRHARSGWALPGQSDFDRALDDIGFAEAELTAQSAADHRIRPDLILCSTAVRCRQTAEPLYRAFGEDIDIRYLDTLYTGPTTVYADLVEAHASRPSLMIIGHNPMMEELFRRILGEERAAAALADGYPPAGMAVIDFAARPKAGTAWTATLSKFLVPAPEEAEKG
jgi:phosphohistidine phosphatase